MINTERLLAEFQKLVSFDCESFHEAAIKDYLKEKLLALGLTVEEDDAAEKLGSGADGAGNLLGRLKGEEEGAPLLFCSHMDTVAPGRGKRADRFRRQHRPRRRRRRGSRGHTGSPLRDP